jgi:hypothetical protein
LTNFMAFHMISATPESVRKKVVCLLERMPKFRVLLQLTSIIAEWLIFRGPFYPSLCHGNVEQSCCFVF